MAKIDKEITELIGKNKVTPNRGLWGVVRRDSGRRSRVSRAIVIFLRRSGCGV